MKRPLSRILDWLFYVAIAAVAMVVVSRKLSGPDEGKPAALFDLPVAGQPGARFRLAEHRGKPILLEVFASWCGACRRAAPALREAWERHGKDRVSFVAVSVDTDPAEVARVQRDWDIPYDVLIDDGSLAKNYGIEVLPTFVLIDSEGIVRHVSTGAPSRSEVERWLASAR